MMHIRSETSSDIPRIREVQYAAFKDHPQHAPGAAPTEHLIVDALREDGALAVSLVAEEDGRVVGHIALSPALVGDEAGWYLLGPVGVLPGYQGRGMGSSLIREALERLRVDGARGVVLVGDPGFYARFGFAHPEGLRWPGVPDTYVLALALGAAAPSGVIACHEAFTAFG